MNMLFIKNVIVGFMVSEIPRVSVFGHCPGTVRIGLLSPNTNIIDKYKSIKI